MEETLTSPKMAEIDFINNLEKISSQIPNRVLKVEGFILKEDHKEQLEIMRILTRIGHNNFSILRENRFCD